MKIKTSELQGSALDWAVAKCIYEPDDVVICDGRVFAYDDATNGFNPSTDWSQGGPIIEQDKISVWARGNEWAAESFIPNHKGFESVGPTPLVAAMRCYVASQLNDEVEVPNELEV